MESHININGFNSIKKRFGFKETPCLSKEFVVKTLVDRYNELIILIEDEHLTFEGKRDLESMGDLIEEIADDLNLSEEFGKGIQGEICWKK